MSVGEHGPWEDIEDRARGGPHAGGPPAPVSCTAGRKRKYNTTVAHKRGRKLSRHHRGQEKSSATYTAAKAAVGVPTSSYHSVRSAIAIAQPDPYARRRKTRLEHIDIRSPTKTVVKRQLTRARVHNKQLLRENSTLQYAYQRRGERLKELKGDKKKLHHQL